MKEKESVGVVCTFSHFIFLTIRADTTEDNVVVTEVDTFVKLKQLL